MASSRFLDERPQAAGRKILSFAESAVGRWLRNDTMFDGPPDSIEGYERGSQQLDDYIEHQLEQQLADAEAQESTPERSD
jgi:hypothetical protein